MAAIFTNLHNVITVSVISSSSNESDLGGAITLLLQDHRDCPIQTKFVSALQNYMKMTIKSSKSKPDVEFPYGIPLFSKCGSGSISAMD